MAVILYGFPSMVKLWIGGRKWLGLLFLLSPSIYYAFQAVIKQFSGTGYESSDVVVIDELEMQRHQQLEKLYRSTRAGKVPGI